MYSVGVVDANSGCACVLSTGVALGAGLSAVAASLQTAPRRIAKEAVRTEKERTITLCWREGEGQGKRIATSRARRTNTVETMPTIDRDDSVYAGVHFILHIYNNSMLAVWLVDCQHSVLPDLSQTRSSCQPVWR